MSDELTPEELEALKNLPRERMPPASLEDRVVGAMRQHGMLGTQKSGRVVRLTRSRYAGLIAATVVLMVGAYSIGLHRGDRGEILKPIQPRSDEVSSMMAQEETTPAVKAPNLAEEKSAPESAQETRARNVAPPTPLNEAVPLADAGAKPDPKLDWKLETTQAEPEASTAMKKESGGRIEPAPSTAVPEDLATRADRDAGKMKSGAAPTPQTNALRSSKDARSSYEALYSRDGRADANTVPSRRFMLGDTALIVEAPDSVRIVEEDGGRVLVIYTSDAIIRIRLAD